MTENPPELLLDAVDPDETDEECDAAADSFAAALLVQRERAGRE